jgi:hypothetical protein
MEWTRPIEKANMEENSLNGTFLYVQTLLGFEIRVATDDDGPCECMEKANTKDMGLNGAFNG